MGAHGYFCASAARTGHAIRAHTAQSMCNGPPLPWPALIIPPNPPPHPFTPPPPHPTKLQARGRVGLPGAQARTQALQGAGSARARPGDTRAGGRRRLSPQAAPHRCALPGAACSLHQRPFFLHLAQDLPQLLMRAPLGAADERPPSTPPPPAQPTHPPPPATPSAPHRFSSPPLPPLPFLPSPRLSPRLRPGHAASPPHSASSVPSLLITPHSATLMAHGRRRARRSSSTRSSVPRRASRRRRRGRASGFPRSAHRASRDARDTHPGP